MKQKLLEPHPYANIFPMMGKAELEALAKDIAANGVSNCGCLYQGKILDGRNRYAACQMAGVDMAWEDADMMDNPEQFDALAYVLSANLHRRMLATTQRALVAAKMATLKRGDVGNGRKVDGSNDLSTIQAATMLSVSEPSVKRAKFILDNGSKELIDAVERNEIKVGMGVKLCKLCDDKREQTKLIKQGIEAVRAFVSPPREPELEHEQNDDVDLQIIKAFKDSGCRLNVLRRIYDALEPHEVLMLAEWVSNG